MDAKSISDARQRLSIKYQSLVHAISRNRHAANELAEDVEDEFGLAAIRQNRDLLYDLNESDFQRLRSIEDALKAIDAGEYGECGRCGEDIKEKRLLAVPWTRLCIQCQEEAEAEERSSHLVLAGTTEPELET